MLVIRNRQDLVNKVIPFFERHPLYTQKKNDFYLFKKIVMMMNEKKHLEKKSFSKIVQLAYLMNANGCRRKVPKEKILETLKSSETIRQKSDASD